MASATGEDELWYFAYGANTSLAVLTGRRGIRPRASEAAVLEGYRLAFAMPGIPFFEPAFATVLAEPGARAEGVLHRFTAADMQRLDRFESRGYTRRELVVTGARSGAVPAQVYLARRPREGLVPSRRYVELLRAGAREHGLSPAHLAWLEAQPCLDSAFARFVVATVARAVRGVGRP